jgi:hypothetical protein
MENTPTTIIHHSADFDGLFCREIAKKFLPSASVIGWNYGDPKIKMPEGSVYIMDLSPECIEGMTPMSPELVRITWIDHHKTAIAKWPETTRGYRIDGVAACRLAWQWFACGYSPNQEHAIVNNLSGCLPTKEEFVSRDVTEPWAVRLAGEYDIWDKRDPWAETFQYALRSVEVMWHRLLDREEGYVNHLLELGKPVQVYATKTDEGICKSKTWLMPWEGLKFLCLNSARFNSKVFAAKDNPETGHDALYRLGERLAAI